MLMRAIAVCAADHWPQTRQCATVTLTYDDRHRRRLRLNTDEGQPFLLDLNETVQLREGDGLELENGEYVRVVAAEEEVADLHCDNPMELARIIWHIGNRHIPAQILSDTHARIRHDHVILEMVRQLGAHVHLIQAPFSPEGGAYEHREHAHAH